MNRKFVIALLFAFAAVAMAETTAKGTTALSQLVGKDMSANPLMTFQGGCQACVGNFPVCLWCANAGPGCFSPPSYGAACCGCVNGACYLCPSSSSCAPWSPYNPSFCPAPNPNNNATVFGTCVWQSKLTLQFQEKSILRCHSIPTNYNAVVNWTIRPNSDGQFSVWVVDQRNFDLFIAGQPFACLNQNCLAADSNTKYGQFTNFGSPGYYFITTKTNRNFSGTSSYLVNAFVR